MAGFNVLVPFIDRVRYKHTLKEQAIDVASQICITRDNISVEVDGILYLQVIDAMKASYGIDHYQFASIQIAQTTMRSIIGKLELDKTFEERETINNSIVSAVDKASDPWGILVEAVELKDIGLPDNMKRTMAKEAEAEREKRALVAKSIGGMESNINSSKASMEEAINQSEGEKERLINEAEGVASEILAIAKATADGIKKIASAIKTPGGEEAVFLRVSENYLGELRKLARKNTNVIIAKVDLWVW